MPSTPRAVGAAVLTAVVLASSAACQTDPSEPAPTAVLPTPTQPTLASPSASIREDDALLREALGTYSDGHQAFERSSVGGGDADAVDEMSEYYSGAYLDLQVMTLKQISDEELQQNTPADLIAVIDPPDLVSPDDDKFEFTACIDFSDVAVTDADGELLERGFEVTQDTVEMVRSDGEWRADDVRSQVSENFSGNCARVVEQ